MVGIPRILWGILFMSEIHRTPYAGRPVQGNEKRLQSPKRSLCLSSLSVCCLPEEVVRVSR